MLASSVGPISDEIRRRNVVLLDVDGFGDSLRHGKRVLA